MDWEDTVMNKRGLTSTVQPYIEAQAEISFKAGKKYAMTKEGHEAISYLEGYQIGKKVGIREVAEWVDGQAIKIWNDLHPDFISHREIPEHSWQAKLKEWGIDG